MDFAILYVNTRKNALIFWKSQFYRMPEQQSIESFALRASSCLHNVQEFYIETRYPQNVQEFCSGKTKFIMTTVSGLRVSNYKLSS